jgi:hypothetical protein
MAESHKSNKNRNLESTKGEELLLERRYPPLVDLPSPAVAAPRRDVEIRTAKTGSRLLGTQFAMIEHQVKNFRAIAMSGACFDPRIIEELVLIGLLSELKSTPWQGIFMHSRLHSPNSLTQQETGLRLARLLQ